MIIRLDGEVAVITGAANGIGRAIAVAMAESGAAVALVDRDEPALEKVTASIRASGGVAECFVADVSDQPTVSRTFEDASDRLGDPTILVAGAGIDQVKHVAQITAAEWQRMLDVNLTGYFYCLQSVLPAMRRRGRGRVVMIGSNIALKGGSEIAAYGAAKGGVHALARCAAIDLAPLNITVNVVAPGPVETNMTWSLPQSWLDAKKAELLVGRFGTVDEIAPTVILLVSEAGAFFTGSTINVSGGDVLL